MKCATCRDIGEHPSYRKNQLRVRPCGHQNAFTRPSYTYSREMAEEVALQRTARLFARNFGGKMEDYLDNPVVNKAAHDFAKEMIYENPNKVDEAMTSRLRSVDQAIGEKLGGEKGTIPPIAETIGTIEAPLRKTKLNELGRGLEYSGAGVPAAAARYLLSGKARAGMTPGELLIFKQGVARQAVRGVVGPAALGALGYTLMLTLANCRTTHLRARRGELIDNPRPAEASTGSVEVDIN